MDIKRFNNLIIYGENNQIERFFREILTFRKILVRALTYKLNRLSIMIINDDIFSCSIVSKCDKIQFMMTFEDMESFNNGSIKFKDKLNKEYFNG